MHPVLRTVLVAVLPFALLTPATVAEAKGPPRPVVLQPASKPYGKTYGEWSAKWWQYVFAQPYDTNPLTDPTGVRCGVAQSGPVFFLGGLYGLPGTYKVNRTRCNVPAKRALFFPILNCENDNTVEVTPPPGPQQPQNQNTAEKLAAECRDHFDGARDLAAEVDGVSILRLSLPSPYRAASPPFAITPPEGNLLQHFNYYAPGNQEISPVVSDGVYLMLAPLSPGQHTLHFRGTNADFKLDVTYRLCVAR